MKDLIEKYNFNFKKKFGQNFLKDKNILENIALKSDIDKDTLVIEIGVGAAALTNVTCNYAKNVIGYEIDETLKPIINEVLGDKDNVEIIFTDFLKRNVKDQLIKQILDKKCVICSLESDDEFTHKKIVFNSKNKSLDHSQIMSINDYIKTIVINHQNRYPDTELSKRLGISRKSLWEKRKKLEIDKKK